MANLKDIKRRIGAVTNTRQITKAMKMVAGAKLRRATEHAEAARPYQSSLTRVLSRVAASSGGDASHDLLESHESVERIAVVVFGSDKGLCGSFNNSLFRRTERFVTEQKDAGRTVVLHGDALDSAILDEANVRATDTIVAVANDDEANILSSLLAKREGCQRAVTLVNDASYGPLMTSLGIDVVVNPRAITVSRILQHVRRGRIRDVYSLPDGVAEVLEAEAMETSTLIGKTISESNLPAGVIIGALVRGDEAIIPRGDTIIEPHDRVIIFTIADMVKKVEKMFSVRLEYF